MLAVGCDSHLKHHTDKQLKPAVSIAGKFKTIDFLLSNSLNSSIHHIGVAAQYRSHIPNQHVKRDWGFLRSDLHEFIEL